VANGTTISGGYGYVVSGGVVSGVTIDSGTLELTSGAVDGSAAIGFAASGGGALRLDASVGFGGLIAGFGQPEHLDLSDIGFGSSTHLGFTEAASNLSGTLMVTDGVHTANLTLLGQYVTAQFTSASDGHGGALIGDPPVATMTDSPPASSLANPAA
jgi:autotransporter passenger strand-loop-strand repeat protein